MKLNDVLPTWKTNGIIKSLFDVSTINDNLVPWNEEDCVFYDLQYHGNNSGGKNISPLVENLLDETLILQNAELEMLSNVILTMFLENWKKLYATLSLIYNPINNYDMKEDIVGELKDTGTATNVSAIDYGKIDTSSANSTGTLNDSTFGFNTTTAVDKDKTVSVNTATSSNTGSGTDETQSILTNDLTRNNTQVLTREGNIGVMTTQQMISQERALWGWIFIKEVYKNIDEVLVLKVY